MALPRTAYDDRRADIRLAGGGNIDAVIIDQYQYPTSTLHSPQVENVSAGGMAISTISEFVPVGSHIKVMLAGVDAMEVPGVVLEVLNTATHHDGRLSLHCRVLEGTVPGGAHLPLVIHAKGSPMRTMRTAQRERRREPRFPPSGPIRVRQTSPVLPLSDAEVIDISRSGVALRTRVPLHAGDRLSFTTEPHRPPVLAEVLAVEPIDQQWYRIRCRCLLGNFES